MDEREVSTQVEKQSPAEQQPLAESGRQETVGDVSTSITELIRRAQQPPVLGFDEAGTTNPRIQRSTTGALQTDEFTNASGARIQRSAHATATATIVADDDPRIDVDDPGLKKLGASGRGKAEGATHGNEKTSHPTEAEADTEAEAAKLKRVITPKQQSTVRTPALPRAVQAQRTDVKKFGASGRGKAEGRTGQNEKTSHETTAPAEDVGEAAKLKIGRGLDVLNPRMHLPSGKGGYEEGKKDLRAAKANVALNNVGQGPNATAALDPDDYGICDTEDVHVTLTAHRVGDEWVASATNLVGDYSKVCRTPAGCLEPSAAAATAANYEYMIEELKSLEGEDWYPVAAVTAHESVHERRLAPALKRVERGIQKRLATLTVAHDDATMNSAAAAAAAIQATPAFANVQAGLRNLWDAKYVSLIFADHWILTPMAERKIVNPIIKAIKAKKKAQGW